MTNKQKKYVNESWRPIDNMPIEYGHHFAIISIKIYTIQNF